MLQVFNLLAGLSKKSPKHSKNQQTHTHVHIQYQHGSEDVFSATHTALNVHIRILQAAVCIYDPLHIVHTCTQLLVNLEVRICSLQLKEYYRSDMKLTEGQDGEEVAGRAG